MYAGENGRERPMVIDGAGYIKLRADAERFQLLYTEGRKEVKKLKERVARAEEEIVEFKSKNETLLKELREKEKYILEQQTKYKCWKESTVTSNKKCSGKTGTVTIPRDTLLTDIVPSFNNLSSKIKQITEDVERTMSSIINACGQAGWTDRNNYEIVRKFFLGKEKEDESVIPIGQNTVFFQGPREWYTNRTVGNIDKPMLDTNAIVPPASEKAFETIPPGGKFYEILVRNGYWFICHLVVSNGRFL
jgi:hypothetical protein